MARAALRRVFAFSILLIGLGAPALAADGPVEALHAFFDAEWERTMRQAPTFASFLGDRRHNGELTDLSLGAIEARHQGDRDALGKLLAMDRAGLPQNEQLNYDLFRLQLEQDIERHAFRTFLMPLNHMNGAQSAHALQLVQQFIRITTVQDYEDWIRRLEQVARFVDQTIELLKTGIAEKRVPPTILMDRIIPPLEAHLVDDPADSGFYASFKRFPDDIADSDRQRLSAAARKIIADSIIPAYQRLNAFVRESYLPATRKSHGIWDFPDGAGLYAHLAKSFTTTTLTPEEIHQIGLGEVARIRGEMETVKEATGFKGDLNAFNEFLRTDPQFYFTDPDDLFDAYVLISKSIDPQLVKLFGKLPRMPYGLKPIPEASAPYTTTAYYQRGAPDGSRAGYYYVNLYKPEVRPKYEMEVLSAHEAVPGHHLQIALAQEMEDLPKFRAFGGFTAFVEGWGLYAESLGGDLGLYQDAYSKYGALTYEMWRAVRLVVDTGMHHMKWTRQQAIDFFKANAAKTEFDIISEIDRYIAMPGQALAYKIGQLKMTQLRQRARSELGDKFDIREFHDVLLGSGGVPLTILERNIEAYIAKKQDPRTPRHE